MSPLDNYATGTNKSAILNNDGCCLRWFQNATNTNSPAEVNVFTNLGAAAYRRPGVNHGTLIDISTNVYIRRHENDTRRLERSITSYSWRNHPYLSIGKIRLQRNFVMKRKNSYFLGFHLLTNEIKKYGFFYPLIDCPFAIFLNRRISHPKFSPI